ncbi:hypothetical protein GCM10010430_27860 [Kitasatospora cystarginea]|uniref:Uncharacterized protein n=1 Tax=Kitasatospora cystarginea TaxID=58350 RepID=A0ABN3DYC2_9ACTN
MVAGAQELAGGAVDLDLAVPSAPARLDDHLAVLPVVPHAGVMVFVLALFHPSRADGIADEQCRAVGVLAEAVFALFCPAAGAFSRRTAELPATGPRLSC